MPPARRLSQVLTFGGRVPAAVGGLVAALVLLTVAGVLAERNGLPLLSTCLFSPAQVWQGEVWRLVTWPLFETEPLGLVFGAMMLWMFGRDLALSWGQGRFLRVALAIAAGAAGVATLLALAWPDLMSARLIGPWPVIDALVVAWALRFPDRQLLFWFALPLSGRALLWITVGATLLYAVFAGVDRFVPHLAAEGLMALWLRGPRLPRIRFPRLRRRRGPFEVIQADRDPDSDRPRWLN